MTQAAACALMQDLGARWAGKETCVLIEAVEPHNNKVVGSIVAAQQTELWRSIWVRGYRAVFIKAQLLRSLQLLLPQDLRSWWLMNIACKPGVSLRYCPAKIRAVLHLCRPGGADHAAGLSLLSAVHSQVFSQH